MSVTVRDALRGAPLRFLASAWPLRTAAYTLSSVAVGLAALVWLPAAMVLGALVMTPLLAGPLAAVERRRPALLGGPAVPYPHRRPDGPGLTALLRTRYGEAVTWRELAYLVLCGSVLLVVNLVALVIGLLPSLLFLSGVTSVLEAGPAARDPLVTAAVPASDVFMGVGAALAILATVPVLSYATAIAAVGHETLARMLLSADDQARILTLTRSRARLIDAFEVERRRIERDLHDGAQQRLLKLGMTLVSAQMEVDRDPAAAKSLLHQATDEARSALTELRDLVRGIHPRVLADLGLPAAVTDLADRSPLPVTVRLDVPRRLSSAVESAAYFVVAEALANVAKHAAATRARVLGRVLGSSLLVEIHDDGVGGADPARGTGLTGLADRVAALDGTLTLSSPPGGPTILRLELPCSA
ncbi:sensor histidine kinase [Thermoactinospora rubra]|uniref:sensor histidine kinase n=1 Tax=Thermoactinospora rubra TaxID=1088767 RepID=UPI000A0FFDF6|nr:histidine kinase [Thermoactinospora rubra]